MRTEERAWGIKMAGAFGGLVDGVAKQLHNNESMHLHDGTVDVADCGYCYLRAGRTLGIIALTHPEVVPDSLAVAL